MKNNSLLSLYLDDYKKYENNINDLIKKDVKKISENIKKMTYEDAIIISEIFGMMPDELFYDDFTKKKDIKEKLYKAEKLHKEMKK